ncbi:hypothetical protein FB45DRAFT_919432 [Roridomyces roridus]|uniref:F-box domain-containing protein n=1 Tax=Roridomyces roridus TaxID=1738132 RepID=A0AAD7FK89_9AGAR|nr:hypothetical protein FB45DRAFT_919432 [Roridomyces roridus]
MVCPRCGHSTEGKDLTREQLRTRIAQLNALIASLDTERRQLEAQSDAIVYPVLSLPPELTSLIFIHCLPSTSLPRPSPLEPPLLVAQICRQWRAIAVGTPELWSSVALSDSHSPDLLDVWLSRSAQCPLNILLDDGDVERACKLVDTCKPYADRWEDVQFNLPEEALLGFKDLSRVPLLKRMSVSRRGMYGFKEIFEMTEAPLLRVAVLDVGPGLEFMLPWQQMTSLTLAKSTPGYTLLILKECPGLLALDLSAVEAATVWGDEAVLWLECLQSFSFPSHFCVALDHLRLPQLTHMSIRETMPFRQGDADALRRFVVQSSPPLQRLSLHLKYPSPQMLARCLDALPPFLRALELHCGNATHVRPALEVLRTRSAFPDFQTLSITGGRVFDSDYAYLAETLEARCVGPSTSSLKAFSLWVQTYGRADAQRDLARIRVMPRFRALAEAGLRIRFVVAGKTSVEPEIWMDTLVEGDFS